MEGKGLSGEQHVPACTLPCTSCPLAACKLQHATLPASIRGSYSKQTLEECRQHLQPKIAGTLSSSCVTILNNTRQYYTITHAHQCSLMLIRAPPSPSLIGFPRTFPRARGAQSRQVAVSVRSQVLHRTSHHLAAALVFGSQEESPTWAKPGYNQR